MYELSFRFKEWLKIRKIVKDKVRVFKRSQHEAAQAKELKDSMSFLTGETK